MTRSKLILFLIVIVITIVGGVSQLRRKCPASGIPLSRERAELHRLKNRTNVPQANDFDERITTEALLASGQDTTRWSNSKAARIEAYVISVASARAEAANCYVGRDTHIHVALRPNAETREHLVLEVTPRTEALAAQKGLDWSAATLQQTLVGRWVAFEGWLMFDYQHAEESENLRPGSPENWRRTAWEIHPVTSIQIKSLP